MRQAGTRLQARIATGRRLARVGGKAGLGVLPLMPPPSAAVLPPTREIISGRDSKRRPRCPRQRGAAGRWRCFGAPRRPPPGMGSDADQDLRPCGRNSRRKHRGPGPGARHRPAKAMGTRPKVCCRGRRALGLRVGDDPLGRRYRPADSRGHSKAAVGTGIHRVPSPRPRQNARAPRPYALLGWLSHAGPSRCSRDTPPRPGQQQPPPRSWCGVASTIERAHVTSREPSNTTWRHSMPSCAISRSQQAHGQAWHHNDSGLIPHVSTVQDGIP